jgi:thioredoxin-like negative regulator of GroEL
MNPEMRRFVAEYHGRIKFCKIDFDKEGRLNEGYGIQELPTILFFYGRQVVDHITGAVFRKDV